VNIKLKNIKYFAAGSEETSCFTASVYIDGMKAGDVKNDGHGGCNYYYPHELETKLSAYADTLPPVTSSLEVDGKPFVYEPNADNVIDELLDEYLAAKELRRLLHSGKAIYTVTDRPGIFASSRLTSAQLATLLKVGIAGLPSKWNAKELLNTMRFEEALEIYRTA